MLATSRFCTLLAFTTMLLVGCADFLPHRLGARPCEVTADADSADESCRNASIERLPGFEIAYVEFTDQGWFHSRAQLDRALALSAPSSGDMRDVQVVLFVHGWKHSAAFGDRDVRRFRDTVVPAFAARHPERRTLGIYVGWRGESIPAGGLDNLTFYDRKATAEHVARGSIRELISRLRALHDGAGGSAGRDRVHVTMIGHSFGGLIVFNAIAESLLDALIRADVAGPKPIVDLALLLNPAFEASRFEPLFQVARRRPPSLANGARPIFVSITSTTDSATGTYFPLGRTVNSLFDHESWTEEDDCPGGLDGGRECPSLERSQRLEKQTNTHTVGNLDRYLTHHLSAGPNSSIVCVASANPKVPGPSNTFPLWTLRAEPEVIDGHSDIYRRELWNFLAGLADPAQLLLASCR